jgi:uncharacterized protein YbjT (DUF2867 family)
MARVVSGRELIAPQPRVAPEVPLPGSSVPVLLTGATGYVGGRLLRAFEAAGQPVRCLTRRPRALAGRTSELTQIAEGDLLACNSLPPALEGVSVAYYLVHSMGSRDDFTELDRRAAENFARAAREGNLSRIIYLGGLGAGSDLSAHLASRHEVGRILRKSGVPVIELRASIVIGSGSASFETIRALVERLPVILAPDWMETTAQPIAVEDVVEYLVAALSIDAPSGALFEIGGSDRVTYAGILREYARHRRLRRPVVRAPMITARVSRLLLGLITPVYGRVAATMVGSLRNETVVHGTAARDAFSIRPRGLSAAIERALVNEEQGFAETRWSDALPDRKPSWGGISVARRRVASRGIRIEGSARHAFVPIQRIGGTAGWYSANWFWRLRGLIDTLRGGVGLRRGRRDDVDIRVGDAIDFWRVERFEQDRLLRLAAEMKIPGSLWLQFEVDQEGHCAGIRQVAVFHPAGYVGLLYWYLLYPVHAMVFNGMLRGIKQQIDALPPSMTRPVDKAKQEDGGKQARGQDHTEPEAEASATLHLGRCSLE